MQFGRVLTQRQRQRDVAGDTVGTVLQRGVDMRHPPAFTGHLVIDDDRGVVNPQPPQRPACVVRCRRQIGRGFASKIRCPFLGTADAKL